MNLYPQETSIGQRQEYTLECTHSKHAKLALLTRLLSKSHFLNT